MKTIRIFLASSEELENDRNAFGNLIRKLNKTYQMRGIELYLFEWEDYDAAYNNRRKQDEYNEKVRASDMFLAVFHIKAGRFTLEEFDVAIEEFRRRGLPKSYVYCKDLKDDEVESQELKEFKERLDNELGHYWSRYSNRDTMQLHFVMQLQLVEGCNSNSLKVEDGTVVLDGQSIAHMENLPFAALNNHHRTLREQLQELNEEIAKLESSDSLSADKEQQLNANKQERNKIREKLQEHEQFLLDAAVRFAKYTGESITDSVKRAIKLFNEGKVSEARDELEKAKSTAKTIRLGLEEYKAAARENIAVYLSSASVTLADDRYIIEERVKKAQKDYQDALELATECDYEAEKYGELLFEYATFLYDYAKYNEALVFWFKALEIYKTKLEIDHTNTAMLYKLYNNIAAGYCKIGEYDNALKYLYKCLEIQEKVLSTEQPEIAMSYNNIGVAYDALGEYDDALKYHFKALKIRENVLGVEHPDTAMSYNNIGAAYMRLREDDEALKYHFKALKIRENVLGVEHPDTAMSYDNIGAVYCELGEYEDALKYLFKELKIQENVLGVEHPDVAKSLANIGFVYSNLGEYNNALMRYSEALEIFEIAFEKEHPDVAHLYVNIGEVYYNLGDYNNALKNYSKALEVFEIFFEEEHSDIAKLYHAIGCVYCQLMEYYTALKYYSKALEVYKIIFEEEHPDIAELYHDIGRVYRYVGESNNALNYYSKALQTYENVISRKNVDLETLNDRISILKREMSELPAKLTEPNTSSESFFTKIKKKFGF